MVAPPTPNPVPRNPKAPPRTIRLVSPPDDPQAERAVRWIRKIIDFGSVGLGQSREEVSVPGHPVFNKTVAAVVTFALLMLAPSWIPELASHKQFELAGIRKVWDMPVPVPSAPPPGPSRAVLEAMLNEVLGPVNPYLYDETGALDHFFEGLASDRTVRVVHYGDSPTTADLITADARKLLQADYGNAGEGFVLIARPWAWYNHRGVAMEANNWGIDVAGYDQVKDGLYGLGGARFRGFPGSTASWTVMGDRPRSVEVSYLTQADGGKFVLEADGEPLRTVDTSVDPATGLPIEIAAGQSASQATMQPVADTGAADADATPVIVQQPAYATVNLPAGGREVTLRVTEGYVKVFGVEFRNNRPGVIYSSLGINGASVTVLSRVFSGPHLSQQLRHYKPDLVVLAYGTNESGFPSWVEGTWGDELRAAIRRVKRALPNASVLLMSPMDRGEIKDDGSIGTITAMPHLVEIEKQIAAEEGVAFFNTFEAMGGEGTMARWYQGTPRLVGADFIHPLPAGAKIVGELLYTALEDGRTGYELRKRREAALMEAQLQQDVRPDAGNVVARRTTTGQLAADKAAAQESRLEGQSPIRHRTGAPTQARTQMEP